MGNIDIAMGGWELHSFDRYFYPRRKGKSFRKLEFYSRYFDAIEVNASFYSTALTPANALRWMEDVSGNEGFMFLVKAFHGFTHTFDATLADLSRTHALLEPIASDAKLGGLLFQFPRSFTNREDHRSWLSRLGEAFRQYPVFVEVRHDSWNRPACLDLFRDRGMRLVNVDLPAIRRHMPLTSAAWGNGAYFRLMGRNAAGWDAWTTEEDGEHISSDRYHYRYSAKELDALASAITEAHAAVGTVYVVFHNDPEANSLLNGFQLRHRLKLPARAPLPPELLRKFPELKPLSPDVPPDYPLFTGAASSSRRPPRTSGSPVGRRQA